ncbi:pentapeptide repeat-containing protein [Nocardia nova]|uniref:pentapeptide repeat-containing protein n=1 Tax=Nocardia nova TaxID=37330 RepID=UPI001895846A|nr:pentapeptide repeat-containing protein [Nocardia nova]MBF6278055.1 pentapeptide repeat-containing protein [Nocardia nova]
MRLSVAVILAVAVGAGIAAAAEVVLIAVLHPARAGGNPIDVTKLAFTVVGGVGGVLALVIAYRRQRDLEQNRFVERFGAAAGQLGASDVAVRIAGVYAMAGVADESDGLRRQQCIDVLCGYLRLPYAPDLGSSHQTKEVLKLPAAESAPEREQHFEYRQNDSEVRRTVIRVIAAHLRPNAEYNWSANDFDFRSAYLEDVEFDGATFSGDAGFEGVTFSGDARFEETTFSRTARFDGATFADKARFDGATFADKARFDGATFADKALFSEAMFTGDAGFEVATFSGTARFHRATFAGDAAFEGATFCSNARFNEVTFSDTAGFGDVTFTGDARFNEATFSSTAGFDGATFSGDAWFGGATFSGATRFERATFSGTAPFGQTGSGAGAVSFPNPKQGRPSVPVFNWATDVSTKTRNIEPDEVIP